MKARTGAAPYQQGVTLTGAQLATIMQAAQQAGRGQRANPLPRPEQWSSDPFAPGRPLPPAPVNRVRPDSGRAEPRLFELPISTNLNLSTAPFVPWRILQEAADIPLFRKCIERRKGVCQLDFVVTIDPKAVAREAALAGEHEKDVEAAMRQKYATDIARVSDWMQMPDRQNDMDWAMWGSALFENRLKYDAAVVYPQRSYGGDLLALRVIAGNTIKPLLDEHGARPAAPYPAFQQILYGFPRGEFTATVVIGKDGQPEVPGFPSDQLYYKRTIYRDQSPYGMSATEVALLDGILWMRRMGWMIAEYTEGVMPDAFLKTSSELDWNVEQWADWLRALNDHFGGNTAERNKFHLMPPGVDPVQAATVAERYRPDYDMFLVKLVAGDYGLTATEVGFPEVGSLGASFHEGEEDVLNRVTRRPDANWLGGYATELAVDQLGMPPVLAIQVLGLESEDEAAADAVAQAQVQSARMTLNQDNDRRGMPSYDFAEADMPFVATNRGIIFIEGSSKLAPPGTLIEPATFQEGKPVPGADGPGGTDPSRDATPAAKSAELAAFRRWAARHPAPGRQFACQALTAADAPDLAGDPRIVLAKGDRPKALAGTGPAGSGTGSW